MQLIAFCSLSFCSLFQSTHSHGVRLIAEADKRKSELVSIHAPTWGATDGQSEICCILMSFNPRTHMGCDTEKGRIATHVLTVSIHAPTWGATSAEIRIIKETSVSIHAPTWGATFSPPKLVTAKICVSIHAPTWGATEPEP